MKKVVLTSLMAVFAVSGAHAANVINNNPLYRPEACQLYSVTDLGSSTKDADTMILQEEFGWGITDRLAVVLKTAAGEADWFDASEWGDASFGLNFRALDMGNWKADVIGSYGVSPIAGHKSSDNGKNIAFLDKDYTEYTWTAGVRGGYVGEGWTVAGHVAFDYSNTESFNWGRSFKNHERISAHEIRLGLDGQLVLNEYWNLVAGAEYHADYDNWSDNEGYWTGKFGANFNFDSNKFIGAYITKEMHHVVTPGYVDADTEEVVDKSDEWKVADGFGFGVTFGIQF